jgi:hypothetical protein
MIRIIKVAVCSDGAAFIDKEEAMAYERMIAAVNHFNEKYESKWGKVSLSSHQQIYVGSTSTERRVFKPKEL